MKGLTDVAGLLVGHATDLEGRTGCTAILCERGAVAGIDVRGSAAEGQFAVLDPLHVTDRIHGVLFTGGSAFGIEAASGVRRYLEHKGIGFNTGSAIVPIVVGAVLYDLPFAKRGVRPTRESGEAACGAATDKAVEEGCVGAGTGASVGKVLGMKNAMKSGIGSWSMELSGGVIVAALVAVNAVGDVRDPRTGKIIAGTRKTAEGREFADSEKLVLGGSPAGFRGSNTTLVCIATNAALDKIEAKKLAQLGSIGVTRAIAPVNMMSDGDTVFAISIGDRKARIDTLGVAAADVVARAIVRAVTQAKGMGGLPAVNE